MGSPIDREYRDELCTRIGKTVGIEKAYRVFVAGILQEELKRTEISRTCSHQAQCHGSDCRFVGGNKMYVPDNK